MQQAFDYYEKHADQIENKKYVTIVDYNRPSSEKRMHIINMQTGDVEDLLVAHGKTPATFTPAPSATKTAHSKAR